ncbi:MAG: carbohydrate ABC transporter permease [Acholeplasmataceae bacterium]|jgi:putative aldouronate transport system permease protein
MKRLSVSEIVFKIVAYVLVILLAFFSVFPLLYTIAVAFSGLEAYNSGTITFYPKQFQVDAFMEVVQRRELWASYTNTLFLTIYGTAFSMLITIFAAYALTRAKLPGQRGLNFMIVFTMWFSAGLVPSYKNYQMLGVNSLWMFVIGFGAQAFNIMLLRNAFNGVPKEIEEAARVDGANDLKILTSVYIPMSKSAIATVTLFYALNRWNGYYWAEKLLMGKNQPLQTFLRKFLKDESIYELITESFHPESMRFAVILLAIIPIIAVYPYLQKYFAKGVNVGGVKE